MLDFYEPDIEKKLDALEKEEAEYLKMEEAEAEMMKGADSDDDNSDGITMDELKKSLAEIRSKKAIFKQR